MPDYPEVIRHRIGGQGGAGGFIEAPLNPYGTGHCPECGADLSELNAEAEAGRHWGTEPLPRTNETYLARARRAVLLGEELPKE